MKRTRHLPAALSNILLVVALAAIWMLFAPTQWAGQVSYVIVDGTSMLPFFHRGDLAIVRQASDYQVGDIVTYQDAFIGAHIIHRIVGMQGDRFSIQGDNNAWVDPILPTRSEIIGRL